MMNFIPRYFEYLGMTDFKIPSIPQLGVPLKEQFLTIKQHQQTNL